MHGHVVYNASVFAISQLVKIGGADTVWESGSDRELTVGSCDRVRQCGTECDPIRATDLFCAETILLCLPAIIRPSVQITA